MTLSQVCEERGLDVTDALAGLHAAGIEAKAGMLMRDIASQNGMSPPELAQILAGTGRE